MRFRERLLLLKLNIMQKAETKYLFERGGTYYARVAVPLARRQSYGRREVVKSLRTKSLTEAMVRLGPALQGIFRNISDDHNASITHATACEQAAVVHQTQYRFVDAVVNADIEDSIAMLGPGLASLAKQSNPKVIDFVALGGPLQAPAMTMRQAWEQFATDSTDLWFDLPHRDRQKKQSKYKAAVDDFEKRVGKDVDILKLTKRDVMDYRGKLLELVENGEWKVDTARKRLMWLRVITRHAYEMEGLKESPFENLRPIKGKGDEEKRPPFSEAEVQAIRKHLIEVDSNPELRAILAVMENTGLHAKEIVFLTEDDIKLAAPIPHLCVQPNEHRSFLKTDNRIRKVPLLGVALDAMKKFPRGFPRYCRDNGSEALSAGANKLIQKVAPRKGTYGYRHRMADLMKAQRVEDTLRDSIMGHGNDGKMSGHYGTEYPLEIKLEVLKKALPEHAY
jgi:integrase